MKKLLTITNNKTKEQSFMAADLIELQRNKKHYDMIKVNGCKKYTTKITD